MSVGNLSDRTSIIRGSGAADEAEGGRENSSFSIRGVRNCAADMLSRLDYGLGKVKFWVVTHPCAAACVAAGLVGGGFGVVCAIVNAVKATSDGGRDSRVQPVAPQASSCLAGVTAASIVGTAVRYVGTTVVVAGTVASTAAVTAATATVGGAVVAGGAVTSAVITAVAAAVGAESTAATESTTSE